MPGSYRNRMGLLTLFLGLGAAAASLPSAEPSKPTATIDRLWLVSPAVPAEQITARLGTPQTAGLVVELSEKYTAREYEAIAAAARRARVPLFGWIEVARQPELARQHPEWLASLGHHDDWRRRFPDFPKPGPDEVVKAFPWVTIWYREAFEAHVERIERLLKLAPRDLAGVYLNDIQGAPSSCGCGNDQCRWAQDYHIVPTAAALADPATPAQFVGRVQKLLPARPVIPVWCIECEEIDQDFTRPGTGYCGKVGCYKGLCWKEYFRQLGPVLKQTESKLAIASFSGEFRRRGEPYGADRGWISASLRTFSELAPKHQVKAPSAESLEPVLQSWADEPELLERELVQAAAAGCRRAMISLIPVDQTWRPLVHVR